MRDNEKPSQEEPSRGVFSAIEGARSRDPDLTEEPAEKTQTTEPSKPATKEPGETVRAGDETVEELRRKLNSALGRSARLESKLNETSGWSIFGQALAGTDQGRKIIERYQRGEPLFTKREAGQVASYLEETNNMEETPVTRKDVEETLQRELQRERQVRDQDRAAQMLADEINAMVEEQMPEFRKIRRNPRFAEFMDWATHAAWGGRIPLHEDVADWDNEWAAKQMTATKKALSMYLASDPKVKKFVDEQDKKRKKERAAEEAAVPSSEGTTSSSQEEPAEKSDTEQLIDGMLNVKGRGKSFASIGSGTGSSKR